MAMSRERINLLRASAIKMMGSCCVSCGETDISDLTVHHITLTGKGRGRGSRERAWDALELAYTKTGFLLCSYCHGLFHSNDTMIWLQQDKTDAFREAMRRDFIDSIESVYVEDVEIFKTGQV